MLTARLTSAIRPHSIAAAKARPRRHDEKLT